MDTKKETARHCFFQGCGGDAVNRSGIDFLCFPKPCPDVTSKLIDCDEEHKKQCVRCQTCFKWLRICKGDTCDDITVIDENTFLCINHFINLSGLISLYTDHMAPVDALQLSVSGTVTNFIMYFFLFEIVVHICLYF